MAGEGETKGGVEQVKDDTDVLQEDAGEKGIDSSDAVNDVKPPRVLPAKVERGETKAKSKVVNNTNTSPRLGNS